MKIEHSPLCYCLFVVGALGLPEGVTAQNAGSSASLAEQTKQECGEQNPPKADFLGELSASLGENSFATVDILAAYAKFSNKEEGYRSGPKMLGIQVSSSVPVTTTTLQEYSDAVLQLNRGGLLNLYFSLSGSPRWLNVNEACDKQLGSFNRSVGSSPQWRRQYTPDRTYLVPQPVPALLRPYLIHGLGMKAFRTGLVDDPTANSDGSDIAAAGVFYIGVGFDGPVWDSAEDAEAGPAGTLDFQATISYMHVNSSTLNTLYDDPDLDENSVISIGAKLDLVVTNKLSMAVEYVTPIGSADDFMGEAVFFNIAYAR